MSDGQAREKIDVAVNVFAKPFMTSLAVLSLLRASGEHIGKIWLQFEPQGIRGDKLLPYCIHDYLKEKKLAACEAFQPLRWHGREETDPLKFADPGYRHGLRYQYAFEHSQSRLLFIMHNDIFVHHDLLGAMQAEIGDAFAIGEIGQCWNCPASRAKITEPALGHGPCKRETYQEFKPNAAQRMALYETSRAKNIFARPYEQNGFREEFAREPWPLPECRVNEWACLINLEKTRPLTAPFGSGFPFGGYQALGGCNLDIGAAWFRDMHRQGLHARHFNVRAFLKHWVGTGKNTPVRYARAEANALGILKKHFPEYIDWLKEKQPGAHL